MPRPLICFMHVRATPAWLSLPRIERADFIAREIAPLIARHPGVSLRYFDAEAYASACSDVLMWQAEDQRDYRVLMDELRDTDFFARPYFELVALIPCVEDGYREIDEAKPQAA